jgi:uncharacterized lipoprotein YehR (DUF1307 family)
MVKRPKHRSDELMLIPFLDILCSLIGVLVLIIVVLVVAQTQRINGRTPEEIERAQEHLRLLKLKQENTQKYAGITEKLQALKELQEKKDEKLKQAEKIKDLLTNSESMKEQNKSAATKLQAELENILREIRGFTEQEPTLRSKIAELLAALAKLQPPDAKKDPTVTVNPAGSGLAAGTSVFFIDAAGDKLTYFWNEKDKTTVSAVPDVIVADANFNAFLESVKKIPQAKLIFLLRSDGMRSYNLGAGWAQSKFGFRVDQIGKLPVPGSGNLDFKLFGKLAGSLQAPPEALAPPTPPPGAPPAMPPATGAPAAPMNAPGPPGAPPKPAPGAPAPAPAPPNP